MDGTVEIVFVPSEKNDADIFTKNVRKETHKEHSMKFMKEKDQELLRALKQFNRKGVGNMKLFQYHVEYLIWIDQELKYLVR